MAREDLDSIRQTMVPTPSGAWVRLDGLADIRRARGPNQISRENGQRKIVVMCNVGDGQDLGSVVVEIQRRVAIEDGKPITDSWEAHATSSTRGASRTASAASATIRGRTRRAASSSDRSCSRGDPSRLARPNPQPWLCRDAWLDAVGRW
jgi:multidrug efflux pump subunit AcrB